MVLCADGQEVARHRRNWDEEQVCFEPLHYLAPLERKPGALDHARPLQGWTLPGKCRSSKDCSVLLLEHHLKALKLPTFLRDYASVGAVCGLKRADYPTYLLRLAERELIERERRATERRIKAANFTNWSKLLAVFHAPVLPKRLGSGNAGYADAPGQKRVLADAAGHGGVQSGTKARERRKNQAGLRAGVKPTDRRTGAQSIFMP